MVGNTQEKHWYAKLHRLTVRVRGLYPVVDVRYVPDGELERVLNILCEAGVAIIQMRDKQLPVYERLRRAEVARRITERYGVALMVNDSVEVFRAVGAEGIHLGRDEEYWFLPVRKEYPTAVIGVSCYGELQRAWHFALQGTDYLAFGSVFPSVSEPHRQVCGLEVVKKAKETFNLFVVAIGGITPDNCNMLTGVADAIAVMGGLFEGSVEANLRAFRAAGWLP